MRCREVHVFFDTAEPDLRISEHAERFSLHAEVPRESVNRMDANHIKSTASGIRDSPLELRPLIQPLTVRRLARFDVEAC